MSTIKVNKIENTATADGGIAIDASGHVTLDGQQLPTAGALSNRNLIINGAMQVAQRGTSTASVTTTGYHATDRMKYTLTTLGTWTVSQENTGFAETWKLVRPNNLEPTIKFCAQQLIPAQLLLTKQF